MARVKTANDIINQVAIEVGLDEDTDPYSSTDKAFIQMQRLLDAAGMELLLMHEWNHMIKEHNFTTTVVAAGTYALPTDFLYMIDQTGWERANNTPLSGPLSPQDWQYLKGRDLTNNTIYATFRFQNDEIKILPDNEADLTIYFEYMNRNWVEATASGGFKDAITVGTDEIQYEPILIERYLKLKFLDAKGWDITTAQEDFNEVFATLSGKDQGAEVLNVGRRASYPYLDNYRNVPDTNYGS